MNCLPRSTPSERAYQQKMSHSTTTPQNPTDSRSEEPTQQLQREARMASWVVRNRKRLSHETKFNVQAHQLNENRTKLDEPAAVYPHALAIRLAKRGLIENVVEKGMDDERRWSGSSSETAVERLDDDVKVEEGSFV